MDDNNTTGGPSAYQLHKVADLYLLKARQENFRLGHPRVWAGGSEVSIPFTDIRLSNGVFHLSYDDGSVRSTYAVPVDKIMAIMVNQPKPE